MRMDSYLPIAMPDCDDMLDVTPTDVMEETGSFLHILHETGSTDRVLPLTTTPKFYVTLSWNIADNLDLNQITRLYFDPNKAFGIARSFKWRHPITGVIYVVRFADKIEVSHQSGTANVAASIKQVRLEVIGKLQ